MMETGRHESGKQKRYRQRKSQENDNTGFEQPEQPSLILMVLAVGRVCFMILVVGEVEGETQVRTGN